MRADALRVEPQQRQHLAAQGDERRIVSMTRIRRAIAYLRDDARGTFAQHDHAIGHIEGFLHIVRHEQYRKTFRPPKPHEFALHADTRERIQLAERFVEH